MGNIPDGRSYLGPGFVFTPLEIVTNSEGIFAKVAEPNWWVAMDLNSNNNVYAELSPCQ